MSQKAASMLEYSPGPSQFLHTISPNEADFPASQLMHWAPLESGTVPGRHVSQLEAPSSETWPTLHLVQTSLPPTEYFPSSHLTQVWEEESARVPGPQYWQFLVPGELATKPSEVSHILQLGSPDIEK